MSKPDQGKGDTVRPREITKTEWEINFERTFGKSDDKKNEYIKTRAIQSETE